jgi:hypothetical protein
MKELKEPFFSRVERMKTFVENLKDIKIRVSIYMLPVKR